MHPHSKEGLLPVTQAVTKAWAAIFAEFGGHMGDGWNGDYPEKLAMDAAVEPGQWRAAIAAMLAASPANHAGSVGEAQHG